MQSIQAKFIKLNETKIWEGMYKYMYIHVDTHTHTHAYKRTQLGNSIVQ